MARESDQLYYTHACRFRNSETGGTLKPWTKTNVVGKALPRVDAYERVSGSAVYPSDLVLPSMLFGAVLRCPHLTRK